MRTDKYGHRVSGVLRGAEQVLGVLQDNDMDNTSDGFNLPQVPEVQNEFTHWINVMMGSNLNQMTATSNNGWIFIAFLMPCQNVNN